MPTTRWDDIEKTIISYIGGNWTATQVAYPNVDFSPDSLDYWIQAHVLSTGAYQFTITGGNTGQMHKGMVHLNLYAKQNKGTGTLKGYVDDLCDLFNHKELVISGSDVIQFFVPKPKLFGADGKWWREIVRCDFEYLD